jgi:phosphotransferase system IIB component
VRTVESAAASRVRIGVGDAAFIDRAALRALGVRALAMPVAGHVHLIVGPAAEAAGMALRRVLCDADGGNVQASSAPER